MSELAAAGHDHREAVAVGGLDDFRVAHGAAGLDDGGHAGGGRLLDAVGERKEAVRRQHAAGRVVADWRAL